MLLDLRPSHSGQSSVYQPQISDFYASIIIGSYFGINLNFSSVYFKSVSVPVVDEFCIQVCDYLQIKNMVVW